LSDPQRFVLEASTSLRLADTASLARADHDGRRPALDAVLSNLLELLYHTADAIDTDHFVRLLPQHSLVGS
jgi:hypothetical protein